MSIIINYPKQFSKEYKDFIIVLSKLSELNNIKNLPFDTKTLSNSKELEKNIKDNLYYEFYIKSNNSRSFHNIKLILLQNLKSNQYIFEGAKLFSKFNKKPKRKLEHENSDLLIKIFEKMKFISLFNFLLNLEKSFAPSKIY